MAWHVAEGDHVVADQPLVSVETEKAVVEIPSPQSGRIEKLLAKPGEHVQVGAPLLAFEEGVHPDTGTVVGSLATPAPFCRPRRRGGTRREGPRSSRPHRPCGHGRGSLASISPRSRQADRAAPSRPAMSRAPFRPKLRRRKRPATHYAARGAPWRSTWPAPATKWCRRPCMTKRMWTRGRPRM